MLDQGPIYQIADQAIEDVRNSELEVAQEPSLTPRLDQYRQSFSPELIKLVFPKRGLSLSQNEAYAESYRKLEEYYRPEGILEKFDLNRVANLMWDCGSLSRYQDSFLRNTHSESLRVLLEGRVENAQEVAAAVRRGEPDALELASSILERVGLGDDDINAQSFVTHLVTIERLKRMEASSLREMRKILADLDYRKREREQARLREMRESLSYQHFRKHGFDATIKVPK